MDAQALHLADQMKLRDFTRLASIIEEYSGIRMPPSKKTMVEGRLRRRIRSLGLPGFDEYCQLLFDGGLLDHELVDLIDAVSTNKTDFFREEQHFHVLVDVVLPTLVGLPDRPGMSRPLKVWSAACSNGAEPYSIAMVLDEFGRSQRGFSFSILGTDISTDVLAKARMGVYPFEMIEPVPRELQRRHFLRPRDPENRTVRLSPVIRQAVHFGRMNLMDEEYPVDKGMDVIFCRNVLFYFGKEKQQEVLVHLCRHLRQGGFLFISHTESVAGMNLPVAQVATSVFQRK
ncbi:MAG TPA: CheR family methyltransferase [Candidatus Sulfotelmatobacter sp.]|jgi:chemotaxis protein methyltransferase CheR|nr:CheR family methyltransferase [Candidatus Sulfotelmatobacter sp.]